MLLYSLTIMILRSVRIGDNGWYDPVDGSIHIDLYAGADGKGTMLFTAAHELTHFIKDQSPEKFQALSDFLMEQYGKKGVPVQALVEEQMAKARKHGNALDPDGAFEEVVADSMESMLTDGKVLQELKQRDKKLWQTVKDYVLELCEKIRKVYKGLKPDSLEGRMVAEMRDAAEEMRMLFTEGLVDAAENFTGSEAQKNTTREVGAVRYQLRAYDEHQKENWKNSKRIVLYDGTEQFKRFIQNALDSKEHTHKKMYFGAISSDLAKIIQKETGIDVENYNLSLGEDEIRKIRKSHGDERKERPRGQRAVTEDDYLKIPDVVQSPDTINRSTEDYEGKPAIEFRQKNGDETITVVAVVSDKRLDLFVQTSYINKKSGSIAAPKSVQADSFTSETPGRTAPTSNIHLEGDDVKKKFSLRDQDVRKMNDVLEKQNEKLREDVASLKELLKLQKSVTGGKLLNQNSLDTAAGYLMRSSGAKGNKAELSGLLNDVYSYISGGEEVTWDEIMERAEGAANWLEEHREQKHIRDPYADEVLREIRGSRITLDESQKAGAEYQFGIPNCHRLMQW